MTQLLYVAIGGALGAALRHLIGAAFLRAFGAGFPWATLCVNVAGSLAMGLVIGWLAKRGAMEPVRLFLATGVLGGFTTFSAFSLDVANLWQRGETALVAVYVTGSVALSIAAVFIGLAIMRPVAG